MQRASLWIDLMELLGVDAKMDTLAMEPYVQGVNHRTL